MKRWISIKNQKGMTLLEVIVSIVILGIVLMAITMFFLSSNRLSILNSDQREVQSEARLAMDQMLMDVRYAKEIELLTASAAIGEKSTTDYNYIYIDGELIYRSVYDSATATRTDKAFLGTFSADASSFEVISETAIGIKIINNKGNRDYDIESTISLPNLFLTDEIVTGSSPSSAIKYKL